MNDDRKSEFETVPIDMTIDGLIMALDIWRHRLGGDAPVVAMDPLSKFTAFLYDQAAIGHLAEAHPTEDRPFERFVYPMQDRAVRTRPCLVLIPANGGQHT